MDVFDAIKTRRSIRKYKTDPVSDEDLYGIRSRDMLLGLVANTTGTLMFSDGTTQAFGGTRGTRLTSTNNAGTSGGGPSDGMRIVADQPIGACCGTDSSRSL